MCLIYSYIRHLVRLENAILEDFKHCATQNLGVNFVLMTKTKVP